MKFYETHFEEYVKEVKERNLHTKLEKQLFQYFPDNVDNLCNIIFYGPSGTGKYSQVLNCIHKYSPSELKYEKRFTINYNKQDFYFKISDIHYEVDMETLGCNSKLLWNEIYQQIVDVVSAKPDKIGIIMCKHFHNTQSELMENFYSYMQKNIASPIKLVFFFITESISFIPENIIQCSQIVHIPRPSATIYKKYFPQMKKNLNIHNITNIKCLKDDNSSMNVTTIFENLYNYIITLSNKIQYNHLRELLYDILIYDIDPHDITWYIVNRLIKEDYIKGNDITKVLMKTYTFFKYYNNNYRPIYHLENFSLFLMLTIHGDHITQHKK